MLIEPTPATRPVDVTGRRRSPATLPTTYRGRVPVNKGRTYPADPMQVEDIVKLLEERDLNRTDRSITVRHGKGDKRGVSAMDDFGWTELDRWMGVRQELPFGAVFCVINGPTAGRAMYPADVRRQLSDAGRRAGLRRRVNPHSLRHAHAVELWREGVDVYSISQQLRHARLDVTARYLKGIDPVQLLEPVTSRRPPMMPIPPATAEPVKEAA